MRLRVPPAKPVTTRAGMPALRISTTKAELKCSKPAL
jgi:hypothetical protein